MSTGPRSRPLMWGALVCAVSQAGCPGEKVSPDTGEHEDGDTHAPPVDDDGDGWSIAAGDCDDSTPLVYPGAEELCDALDNDCDGGTNEGWYVDSDGDGFGRNGSGADCDPASARREHGDCDDSDPTAYPGADELCDDLDNDCDGGVNEGWYSDLDGDGVGDARAGRHCDPASSQPETGDCDDSDPTAYPGAEELCDALDNDCDGRVNDGWYTDGDGDGYAGSPVGATCDPTSATPSADDCDEEDDTVHPGATEDCLDGIDNDCSGLLDCEEEICATIPTCFEYGCADGLDDDSDGFTDCDDDDCWGKGCTGTRMRVSGGRMVMRAEAGGWASGESTGPGGWGCDWYWNSSDHVSVSATLSAVTGTIQVATEAGYAWDSCRWSAADVAVRFRYHHGFHGRGDTLTHYYIYSTFTTPFGGTESTIVDDRTVCTSSVGEVTTSTLAEPGRGSFYVEPGCGAYDSSVLPVVLTPGLWPPTAWYYSGQPWYAGDVATLTYAAEGSMYGSEVMQTVTVPDLNGGAWIRDP